MGRSNLAWFPSRKFEKHFMMLRFGTPIRTSFSKRSAVPVWRWFPFNFQKKVLFFNVTHLGNSMLLTTNVRIKSVVFENEISDLMNFFWFFLRGKKNCKVLFVSKLNKSYLWNIFIFDIFQYIFEYSPLLIDLFLANSFLLTYLCTVFYSFYPQTFPVNRYLFLRSKLLHARTDDFSICNFLLHLGFF